MVSTNLKNIGPHLPIKGFFKEKNLLKKWHNHLAIIIHQPKIYSDFLEKTKTGNKIIPMLS